MTPQVFNLAFPRLQQDGVVIEDGALARLPGYEPTLNAAQRAQADAYLALLEANPFSPPTDAPPDAEVLNLLDEQGKVVKVSESVVFSVAAYERMVELISAHITQHGEILRGECARYSGDKPQVRPGAYGLPRPQAHHATRRRCARAALSRWRNTATVSQRPQMRSSRR